MQKNPHEVFASVGSFLWIQIFANLFSVSCLGFYFSHPNNKHQSPQAAP